MKFFDQLLNYEFNFYSFLSTIFFSFLPISIIMGNFTININIILLDILLLIYCLHSNHEKFKNILLSKNRDNILDPFSYFS